MLYGAYITVEGDMNEPVIYSCFHSNLRVALMDSMCASSEAKVWRKEFLISDF